MNKKVNYIAIVLIVSAVVCGAFTLSVSLTTAGFAYDTVADVADTLNVDASREENAANTLRTVLEVQNEYLEKYYVIVKVGAIATKALLLLASTIKVVSDLIVLKREYKARKEQRNEQSET